MKFLHLSDLHLGKTVDEISMIDDQRYMLDQALDLVREEKIEAVLIAGDVYDRAVPPEDAVALLDCFLNKLSGAGIPVLIISGNHDSEERLNFGSRLFAKSRIYIAGKYGGKIEKVTLQDAFGPVNFWLLPSVQRKLIQYYWPDDDTSTYESAVRAALSHEQIDPSRRNVILAHQFVTGGETDPDLSGSEVTAKNVGTIDRISSTVFDAFDYAALGHIHRPQKVGRETVRYGGSLLKYSKNEIDQPKCFTIVDMKEKGQEPQIRLLDAKPLHEMRQIRGPFKELIRPENILYPDDYMFVTLTDKTPVPDAFALIRERYKNAMGLRYESSGAGARLQDGPDMEEAEKSFDETMRDFYMRMLGQEPTEDEMAILKQAAEEAEVSGS